MVWLIIVIGILLTGLTGIPVGVGLGLTGLFILQFLAGDAMPLAVTAVWNVFNDFILSAVPMYIYMGEILLLSGVGHRMYKAVAPIFNGVPGGLLHTNIAVCTLFGSVSGASTSTAAAVGSVAYPELKRRGYEPAVVIATLAAGGTLGLLIPPSLSLLIYGATQGVSIGRLFLAGIVPGLLLAAVFMGVILILVKRNASICPAKEVRDSFGAILRGILAIWPVAFLVFAVLGTIYLGIATPTEAAGLGVVAAAAIGFLWGDLNLQKLLQAFRNGTLTFGVLGVVLIGALILSQAISILGVPGDVMQWIASYDLPPHAVFGLVALIYLLLGCFFDGISMMLMTLPIVYPVLTGLGFDGVWLGVVITILIEIGMLTPPVGLNLYVLMAIARGEVGLATVSHAALPFWFAMLLAISLFTVFPQIVLLLPNVLM